MCRGWEQGISRGRTQSREPSSLRKLQASLADQGSAHIDAAAWSLEMPAYLPGHSQGLLVASGITPTPSIFLATWNILPFLAIERSLSTKSTA